MYIGPGKLKQWKNKLHFRTEIVKGIMTKGRKVKKKEWHDKHCGKYEGMREQAALKGNGRDTVNKHDSYFESTKCPRFVVTFEPYPS